MSERPFLIVTKCIPVKRLRVNVFVSNFAIQRWLVKSFVFHYYLAVPFLVLMELRYKHAKTWLHNMEATFLPIYCKVLTKCQSLPQPMVKFQVGSLLLLKVYVTGFNNVEVKVKFCDSNAVYLENFFDVFKCTFVPQQHIPDFNQKTFVRVVFFFYSKNGTNKQAKLFIYSVEQRTGNNPEQKKTLLNFGESSWCLCGTPNVYQYLHFIFAFFV